MNIDNKPILTENKNWRKTCKERGELEELFIEQVDSLPKEEGVVRDKKYVNWIDCPICKSDLRKLFFLKKGFLYVSCRKCKHVYIQNQLKNDYLAELYTDSSADNKNVELQNNDDFLKYWNLVYDKYFKIVSRYAGSNSNILDIGCGIGNFLKFLKFSNEGKKCSLHGLELNHKAAAWVKEIVDEGDFYNKPIQDIKFNKSFGQIYLWGVLEHLSDPMTVLKKCYEILDDDGVLFFLVPNINSLAVKILGVHTPTFNPRAHIQFFTTSSLEYICNKLKFKEVRSFHELPVIDLMYKYVDYSEELAQEIADDGEGYYSVHILKKNKN